MKTILLLLLISTSTLCFADMGTCYCVEAEIENTQGEVNSLTICGVGTSIITNLKPIDKQWVKAATKTDQLGGAELCEYTAIHYQQPTDVTEKLMNELKKAINEENESQIKHAKDKIESVSFSSRDNYMSPFHQITIKYLFDKKLYAILKIKVKSDMDWVKIIEEAKKLSVD